MFQVASLNDPLHWQFKCFMFIGPCLLSVTQVPADGNLTSWRVPAVMCISLAGKVPEEKECKQDRWRNGERHGEWGDEGCVVSGRLDENWRPKKSKSTCAGRISINQSLHPVFFFSTFYRIPSPVPICDSIQSHYLGQGSLTVCMRVHECVINDTSQWQTFLEIKSLWQTNLSTRTHSKQSGMERACERGSER